MKLVHVVIGNTFPKKSTLIEMEFKWMPDEKIWVKWLNHDDDAPNKAVRAEIEQWNKIAIVVTLHDAFVGTCVDPLRGDKNKTKANYPWRQDLDADEKAKIDACFAKPKVEKQDHKELESHPWDGKKAELTKYAARSVQEKLNEQIDGEVTYLYRNVVITKVHKETAKAIHASVEFFAGIGRNCHVCGAKLDTEISRACGIGPVCARNMGLPRPNKNNASVVLAQIEKIAGGFGTVGPVWIPKSCVEIIN